LIPAVPNKVPDANKPTFFQLILVKHSNMSMTS
jgi:hypothetical protein